MASPSCAKSFSSLLSMFFLLSQGRRARPKGHARQTKGERTDGAPRTLHPMWDMVKCGADPSRRTSRWLQCCYQRRMRSVDDFVAARALKCHTLQSTSTSQAQLAHTKGLGSARFRGFFRKDLNQVRDQEVGGSNPLAPTIYLIW